MDIGIPVEAKQFKKTALGKEIISEPAKTFVPFKAKRHMNIKSEIAHVRFKTRMNGNMKVLSVEEMQSDFRTAAQRSKTESGKRITDFPFKNTWYELTVKRLIRYAADNGFDAVAIPKGSVAAKRYNQNIDKVTNLRVNVYKHPKGKIFLNKKTQGSEINEVRDNFEFDIGGYNKDDQAVFSQRLDNKEIYKLTKEYKIPNHLKEHIDSILEGRYEFGKELHTSFTTGVPEKVVGSGKGKHELYDKAIPSFMKKYSKKWNAKVYDENITIMNAPGPMPVTILELTPAMKKSVQETSQPLFELFGGVSLSTWGAKAVSDNIENNIISNKTN